MFQVRENQFFLHDLQLHIEYAIFVWKLHEMGEIVMCRHPYGGFVRNAKTANLFPELDCLNRCEVWVLLFAGGSAMGYCN